MTVINEVRKDKAERKKPLNTPIKNLLIYTTNDNKAQILNQAVEDIEGTCKTQKIEIVNTAPGGELSRFYLCRICGTIREEESRPDGTLTGVVRYRKLDSVDLPAAVVEQARAILNAPHYDQLSLFGGDQ